MTNLTAEHSFFHRATKTVRIEMICRSFKHFSQKRAHNFVPLPYQPENNDIPVKTPPTGFDALRTIAVSRIYLDNFDHLTAYRVGKACGVHTASASMVD